MGESELPNCKACRRTVMSASNRVPLEITMRSAPGAALWSCCRSVYDAPATLGEISGNFYGILSDKEKGDNRPEQMVICCPDGKPLTEATYTELIRRAEAHSSALPADPLQLTAYFVTKELISRWEENKRLTEENKRLSERINDQEVDIHRLRDFDKEREQELQQLRSSKRAKLV